MDYSKRTLQTTHSMTVILKSIQLAAIQGFTALWKTKNEQIVVVLNFCQLIKMNGNNCYVNSGLTDGNFLQKSLHKIKYTHAMKCMIKSTQLAIIQAFTALWHIKIKQIMVILMFDHSLLWVFYIYS